MSDSKGPPNRIVTNPSRITRPETPFKQSLINSISNQSFSDWYNEREFTQNILDGQLYFNGLAPPPEPEKHTPSKLLQCHRKVAYGRENAPVEEGQPNGLFWTGERFEEDVVVPYLQDTVTTKNTYVQNSKWINSKIETDKSELRLRGSTDPIIVTGDGTPLLVTEVKTKSSIEQLDRPDRRHKAQLSAYLYALDEEFDVSVKDGLLIYGSRTTFDIETFHVQFSEDFWASVVEWMEQQTQYRANNELPPADPANSWECNYCSYRHRCGQTDAPFEDVEYSGLLPGVSVYRKQQVQEYLEADEHASLTPTLAKKYPELVEEFSVTNWRCPECGNEVPWDELGEVPETQNPICKQCAKQDRGLQTLYVPVESK